MADAITLAEKTKIQLDPKDWYRAHWRQLPPLPTPPPQPFDWDDIMQRFESVQRKTLIMHWKWDRAKLSPGMSRQEAHFWLTVITQPYDKTPESDPYPLTPDAYTGDDRAYENIRKVGYYALPELIIPLARLIPLKDILPKLFQPRFQVLADGFRQYILPYLTIEERAELVKIVKAEIATTQWPGQIYSYAVPNVYLWAAFLGMPDQLLPVVQGWTGQQFGKNAFRYGRKLLVAPVDVILGLGKPELVISHMKRQNLRLQTPDQIRAWLAITEQQNLDYIRDSILNEKGRNRAKAQVEAFGLVQNPIIAEHMLQIMAGSPAAEYARQWLDAHPQFAAEGLQDLASQNSNLGKTARDYLRTMARAGHDELLSETLDDRLLDKIEDHTVDIDKPPFTAENTPEWLAEGTKSAKQIKGVGMPRWLQYSDLPPLVVGDHCLNEDHIKGLIQAFKGSTSANPHKLIQDVRLHAEPLYRDEFAWRLMERWQYNGSRSDQMWALQAIGLLGTDAILVRMNPIIREWARRGKRKWVRTMVSTLRDNGSDIAISQLFQIRQTLHRKKMHQMVDEALATIANTRHLNSDQLADRSVPDCGLDENGTRIFDYGRRQFTFIMGTDMIPMVRDEKGKIRKNLPRGGKTDDTVKSEFAYNQWKSIKKQIRETIKTQSTRLERAMRNERRWTWDEFEQFYLKHSLMQHIVQQVIWGTYADRMLTQTFRVAADFTFSDRYDDPITLDENLCIGIVHPCGMTHEERIDWGTLMQDYEIMPLFPQTNREIYTIGEEDRDKLDLADVAPPVQIHLRAVNDKMNQLGWGRRGSYFYDFPEYNIAALLDFRWVDSSKAKYETAQEVDSCVFFETHTLGSVRYRRNLEEALPLGTVPEIIISEVMRDIAIGLA